MPRSRKWVGDVDRLVIALALASGCTAVVGGELDGKPSESNAGGSATAACDAGCRTTTGGGSDGTGGGHNEPGSATSSGGATCAPGFATCNGKAAICGTDLMHDLANCGACDAPCNGNHHCTGGKCK